MARPREVPPPRVGAEVARLPAEAGAHAAPRHLEGRHPRGAPAVVRVAHAELAAPGRGPPGYDGRVAGRAVGVGEAAGHVHCALGRDGGPLVVFRVGGAGVGHLWLLLVGVECAERSFAEGRLRG